MHVLVTRPLREAQRTAAALRARGHDPIIASVLEIVGTNAKASGTWDGVIVTSAQAFDHINPDLRELTRNVPLYVVGARSADKALNCGLQSARIVASDVDDLIKQLTPLPAQRLLYLCGQDRKSKLEDFLRSKGHQLTSLTVYEARAIPALPQSALAALRNNKIDAALHYSRRSAELFCKLAQGANLSLQAQRLRHICISRDAAAPFGPNAVIAKTPDQEGLFAALELG